MLPQAEADGRAPALVRRIATLPGVDDVRYDREFLAALGAGVRTISAVGLALVTIMALAAAVTVAAVVRLGLQARHDEIAIMELVGAPLTFIRGPFVAEGLLQGGIGAILALLTLIGGYLRRPGMVGGGAHAGVRRGGARISASSTVFAAPGGRHGRRQRRRICRLPSRRFHKCDLALTDVIAAG